MSDTKPTLILRCNSRPSKSKERSSVTVKETKETLKTKVILEYTNYVHDVIDSQQSGKLTVDRCATALPIPKAKRIRLESGSQSSTFIEPCEDFCWYNPIEYEQDQILLGRKATLSKTKNNF